MVWFVGPCVFRRSWTCHRGPLQVCRRSPPTKARWVPLSLSNRVLLWFSSTIAVCRDHTEVAARTERGGIWRKDIRAGTLQTRLLRLLLTPPRPASDWVSVPWAAGGTVCPGSPSRELLLSWNVTSTNDVDANRRGFSVSPLPGADTSVFS